MGANTSKRMHHLTHEENSKHTENNITSRKRKRQSSDKDEQSEIRLNEKRQSSDKVTVMVPIEKQCAFEEHSIQTISAVTILTWQHVASSCIRCSNEGILVAVSTNENDVKILANTDGTRLLRIVESRAFHPSTVGPAWTVKVFSEAIDRDAAETVIFGHQALVSSLVPATMIILVDTILAALSALGTLIQATGQSKANVIRKTTVLDVMRRLIQARKNETHCQVSNENGEIRVPSERFLPVPNDAQTVMLLNIQKTCADDLLAWNEVHENLQRIRERRLVNFIDWVPASIQVALSIKSPYVQTAHRVRGLMLASHTSIRHLFIKCLSRYDKLRKKQAFIDNYAKLFSIH